jgi:hypothetical protein
LGIYGGKGIYMKKPFLIKVDEGEKEEWQRQAEVEEISLAEWIRRRCNGEMDKDVSRVEGSGVVGELLGRHGGVIESTAERIEPTLPRVSEKSKKIKTGDETAARKMGHELGCACVECENIRKQIRIMLKEG